LVGLLFVSVSIRITVISGSADLRNREAQTLVLFAGVLVLAILLSIPRQPVGLVGRRSAQASLGSLNP
jgi:hypothetical protein